MLSSPLIILSLVIATLYGAAFHLFWGKKWKQLLVSWVAAVAGFAVGQVVASATAWRDPLAIGELRLVAATVVSWLFLLLARQLRL